MFYHLPMAAPPTQSLVLTFEQARQTVEQHASQIIPTNTESVDLLHAAHRILVEPVVADRDIPPFPRSTRDGYAVRSADLSTLPAKLKLIGEIKAGPAENPRPIVPGETYLIMTGAPVPPGADAVVMIEYTSEQAGIVEIARSAAPGENIVPQAAEAKRGTVLLGRGMRLHDSAIALAASVGKSQLQVFTRPRIAILTTGDEIIDIDQSPGPAQIRNSNSYSLAVQIQQAGGEPVILPIAPDQPRRLRELIDQGLESDLLIMTGGVSMGRYDLVEQVLAELQAEFFFTGAKIQPGRPVVFGRCGAGAHAREKCAHKYFFGLPGNPVSTMVTFELFARPILEALAGMPPRPLTFTHARLKSAIHIKPGLTRFLPAILSGEYADSHVELVPWQGSGDIAAQSRSNCYIVIPPDREQIAAGEWAAIMGR
ncbi:MAG TPA: gephyrin-like molybdotransferase Glp [Candidatus Aquilonibacter sp.]|nr:gephyrin-like molybdotransferase Glp [Candidatus Aquilonibacter sp.]